MQLAVVILIVALSVAYALWRLRRAVRQRDSACAGCTSASDCPFSGRKTKNECAKRKK